MKITKINLPNDARALLSLNWMKRLALVVVLKLADVLGFYKYPLEIGINPLDPSSLPYNHLLGSYLIYKTIHPIKRAKKGSDLEKYFESNRVKPASMLPPDFDIETELSISLVGDLMATSGSEKSKNLIYKEVVNQIFDVDIAFANLESTMTRGSIRELEFKAGETPKINLTPDQYDALIQHEGRFYDIVQLSNNHILDCGEEGLSTTFEFLKKDKVASVGTNESQTAAEQGMVLERRGLKIGWAAFTYSVNFKRFPEGKPYMVNMVPFHLKENPDLSSIKKQIQWCRDQGCDLVVLGLHWGLEFELFPHPNQLGWAHTLAEAGADVIVGHHPHVSQPLEFYRTKRDPDRLVPIFYSLGNLTPIFSNPATVLSLIANLKVVSGSNNGTRCTYVADVGVTPTAIVSSLETGNYGLRLFKVADLCGMGLDSGMEQYVSEIAFFADIVLGSSWR